MNYKFNMKNVGYTLAYLQANRGSGKTLLLTEFAKMYSQLYPKNTIYANFYLKLPNFQYIPDCYLPHSKLENCFIGFDDSRKLKGMDELITTIENMTRKRNLFIFLVGHDLTDFLPRIRNNSEYMIIPKIICSNCNYNDFESVNNSLDFFACKKCKEVNTDVLKFVMVNRNNDNFRFKIDNPLRNLVKYYDTKQVVKHPTNRNIIEIIKKNSLDLDDLEINISIFTKNSAKRNKLFKMLSIELGFLHPDTNFSSIIL